MRTAYFLADCVLRRLCLGLGVGRSSATRSSRAASDTDGDGRCSVSGSSSSSASASASDESVQRAELCLYDALLRLFMAPRPQRQFLSVSPRLEALYTMFAAINALKRVPLSPLAQLGRASPSLPLLEAVAELNLTVAFATRKFLPLPLLNDLLFVRDRRFRIISYRIGSDV